MHFNLLLFIKFSETNHICVVMENTLEETTIKKNGDLRQTNSISLVIRSVNSALYAKYCSDRVISLAICERSFVLCIVRQPKLICLRCTSALQKKSGECNVRDDTDQLF